MLPRLRRKLTAFLSLALTALLVVATIPAHAFAATISLGSAGSQLGLVGAQMEPASVLGLESDDPKAGVALTEALRKAFAKRGLSGGDTMSLVEVRLTMGCNNDEPACLAEGGKTLGVEKLVYGYLRETDVDKFQLEIIILDVASAQPDAQDSIGIAQDELAPGQIDATAQRVVNELFPEETAIEPVPTPRTVPGEEPDDNGEVVEDQPPREGKYWFGRDKNSPTWKKAGLGVGVALTVVGIVGIAFGFRAKQASEQRGPLYDKIVQAAINSTMDDVNDGMTMIGANGLPAPGSIPNDVPNQNNVELCRVARHRPNANSEAVWNADVATLCRRGDTYATLGTVGWVAAGVGLGLTLTFTALLLIHNKEKNPKSAWNRHELRLGATPARGGASLGSSFRF